MTAGYIENRPNLKIRSIRDRDNTSKISYTTWDEGMSLDISAMVNIKTHLISISVECASPCACPVVGKWGSGGRSCQTILAMAQKKARCSIMGSRLLNLSDYSLCNLKFIYSISYCNSSILKTSGDISILPPNNTRISYSSK